MRIIMTILVILAILVPVQGWGLGWGLAGYRNLPVSYRVPLAEPEPEPERISSWTLANPQTIPIPEPEPEPLQRRLSRNLIPPRNHNMFRALINTQTQTKGMLKRLISARNKIKNTARPLTTPATAVTSSETTYPVDTEIKENTERINKTFKLPQIVVDETKRTQGKPQNIKTWSVDVSQFEIVAAVPTEDDPEDISLDETLGKPVQNEDTSNDLSVFTAVEAVPSNTEGAGSSLKKILHMSKKIEGLEKCKLKCATRFCDPEEEIMLFNICKDKCRGLCQI